MKITRWVDAKAALNYVRRDAMVGRVRHWLPKQLTGLDKIYAKTGLSFGIPNSGSNWNAHGEEGICFNVDRTRLGNLIADIDGHMVFQFSDAYNLLAQGVPQTDLARLREVAIRESLAHPDEAFVVGDIRCLSTALIGITIGNQVPTRVAAEIAAYAERHGVPVYRGYQAQIDLERAHPVPEDEEADEVDEANDSPAP